jgi:putative hydrolase of the HAD superfamily
MRPITAVLFDYGLVLTGPPDPAAWARMKLLLHAEESPFHAAYWAHRHAYDRGDLTGRAYWAHVAADLHRNPTPAGLDALIAADTALWTQPNQPMIDFAASLQRAGYKTGILSNIGNEMETGVRDCCPWLAAFTHLTFSHNLRLAKPDPAIYLHAATGLATPTSEILFIDDREDNIAAARTAGMATILYTTHPAFLETMRTHGFAPLLNLP